MNQIFMPCHSLDRRSRNLLATFVGCLLSAALLIAGTRLSANELAGYTRIDFSLPADTERMLIADADGDGLNDLITFADKTVRVYLQNNNSFDFSVADTELELPGEAIGWDVKADFALIALIDGQRVLRWGIENRRFSAPTTVIDGLNGFLAKGVFRLNFVRDINNDGLDDLIIPGAGELALYIRNPDNSFQAPLNVLSDMRLRAVLDAGQELGRDVGQALRIPLMELRDVNNDGLPDLISDTEERLDVFLANAGSGNYFPAEPDVSVDRVAIRERLGDFDIDQLDFANLTGVLALTHEEILQDMNGDGIADLILREGGRVALHLGSPDGINLEQPDQILRSSGNVLSVFMYDENEDGRPDLWLWRVDQVSLGDVFLWLAISGTINLEAFIYHNEGDNFARRPARRITVALRFPSVVRMISTVNEVRERARQSEAVIPAARAIVSAESLRGAAAEAAIKDLVVLMNDQLQVFYQAVQEEPVDNEDRFLASLNYTRSNNSYEIDIRRIIEQFDLQVNSDVKQVSGRTPGASIMLQDAYPRGEVIVSDLNKNGRDDIFVFLEKNKEAVTGMLLLSD
jgi:hypothetical protein